MKPAQLKLPKSILKLKKPVKETKCGFRYKIASYKRRNRDKTFKSGRDYFFCDYGDKACLYFTFYSLYGNKNPELSNSISSKIYWFSIKNGKLKISSTVEQPRGIKKYRNISNGNSAFFNEVTLLDKTKKLLFPRFLSLFNQFLARNGLKVKRKYSKFTKSNKFYLLSYPELEYIFDVYGEITIDKIDGKITKCLKNAKGINHILDRTIGNHGKQIKKILNKNNLFPILEFGRLFKDRVNSEKLINILIKTEKENEGKKYTWGTGSNHKYLQLSRLDYRKTRSFLKNYRPETVFKWINDLDDWHNIHNLQDSINQYSDKIILPDTNNLEDIHNDISRQYSRIQAQPIYYTKTLELNKEINNLEFNNFRLEIPPDSLKLQEYGQKMGNCIYSYKKQMIESKDLLFGIYKDNELTYNIWVSDKKIRQFYAKHNKQPDSEDRKIILDTLFKYAIIDYIEEVKEEPVVAVANDVLDF